MSLLPDACTNINRGHFLVDLDPDSVTSPYLSDTDGAGTKDGTEDWNRNGQVDALETDPSHSNDDQPNCVDTDADHLCDEQEIELGLNHLDGDSDDDGVLDGDEDDWAFDADGDGLINVLDADSDNDYLPDGLEVCLRHHNLRISTWLFCPRFRYSTQSWMQLRDSDNGGAFDGEEDPTRDGVVGG